MIADELNEKLPKLLDILNKELHVIDEIIQTQQKKIHDFGTPIIDRNMPKVSGQISFAKELKQKIDKSVETFKSINHTVIEGAMAAKIIDKANSLIQILDDFEENVFINWAKAAEKNTSKVNICLVWNTVMDCLLSTMVYGIFVEFGQTTAEERSS